MNTPNRVASGAILLEPHVLWSQVHQIYAKKIVGTERVISINYNEITSVIGTKVWNNYHTLKVYTNFWVILKLENSICLWNREPSR